MNKFFTILFIPEKTNQVRRIVIPAAYLRIGIILGFLGSFLVAFMIYDYVNVMQQLAENRKLVVENRQLRQKIQTFSAKLTNVEESLERVQTFATKLRIITNQGDEDSETLKEKVNRDIPGVPMDDHSVTPGTNIRFERSRGGSSPIDKDTGDDFTRAPPPQLQNAYQAALARGLGRSSWRLASLNAPSPYSATDAPAAPATPTSAPAPMEAIPTATSVATAPAAEPEQEAEEAQKKKALSSVRRPRGVKISDLLQEEQDVAVDEALEKEFDRLYVAFQEISKLSRDVEVDIQDLASTLLDQKDYLSSMPTLKPSNGWYTSGFGMRTSPYTGLPAMHEGLDIANHHGQPILAPADGVVSFAGVRPGYGKLITMDHGYGIQTQYGHISKFYVTEGQRVRRGQKISAIGSTGRSTGPHVHYEVRVNGIPVDPYFYILND